MPANTVSRATRKALVVATAAVLPIVAARGQVTLQGTVFDSVMHRPLAGALVQIVLDSSSEAHSAQSDSAGAFRFDNVKPGHYIIGFFHSAVDSLGLDLLAKRITVATTNPMRVDLAIPSPQTIVAGLCGASAARDSLGALLGHVRDAETDRPRAGTVIVDWVELSIGQTGIHRERRQYPAKTDELGWYALCGLPSGVDLAASARADSAESGVVEVRVPAGGIALRDFLVSRADSTIAVYADSTRDSARAPLATLRRGHARLSGVVHNGKGQPIGNAEVTVPGTGVSDHTPDAGTFALAGLPSGTQTLDVRAIGFEPKRVPVDLSGARLTTVDVVLDRPVQTLDVVRVYGKGNSGLAEFQRRRRSGWGHFLTPADIERRHALRVSDLFRTMPGVRVVPTGGFGSAVLLRGGCLPTVYLNGMRLADDAARDLDSYANPSEITAVEVYSTAGRPPEFWGNSCGTVVVWAGMLPR